MKKIKVNGFTTTDTLEGGLNALSMGERALRSAAALEVLKERLLEEKTRIASDAALLPRLRRAAEEAASLAWATSFPLLVLPELFSERAVEAVRRARRQRDIRNRSRRIVALAV